MSNAAKQLNPEFRVVGCTKHHGTWKSSGIARDNSNGPFPSVVSRENPLRDTLSKRWFPRASRVDARVRISTENSVGRTCIYTVRELRTLIYKSLIK